MTFDGANQVALRSNLKTISENAPLVKEIIGV